MSDSNHIISNMAASLPTLSLNDMLDVSIHPCCWLVSCPCVHCGCCPYRTLLLFDTNLIVRTDVTVCGERISYRPYSTLGSIEQGYCCCFYCVDSDLGTIIPGWGCCQGEQVHSIAMQLKSHATVATTSTITAAQQQEQIHHKTAEIYEKMELVTKHLLLHQVTMPPEWMDMPDR